MIATKSTKKIPVEVQQLIGQANNLYAFKDFKEVIIVFEKVIIKIPESADTYVTIANIYGKIFLVQSSFN
jgi:hypothetical protein